MTIPQDQRQAWLALYMIPGLGNVVLRRLFEKFLDVKAILDAGFFDLMGVEGLRKGIARKILDRGLLERAEAEILKAERAGAKVLTYQDPAYPVLLRELHNPPMVLFVKGREIPLEQTFVGLVGSRNPSHYGLKAAENISMALSACTTALEDTVVTACTTCTSSARFMFTTCKRKHSNIYQMATF